MRLFSHITKTAKCGSQEDRQDTDKKEFMEIRKGDSAAFIGETRVVVDFNDDCIIDFSRDSKGSKFAYVSNGKLKLVRFTGFILWK